MSPSALDAPTRKAAVVAPGLVAVAGGVVAEGVTAELEGGVAKLEGVIAGAITARGGVMSGVRVSVAGRVVEAGDVAAAGAVAADGVLVPARRKNISIERCPLPRSSGAPATASSSWLCVDNGAGLGAAVAGMWPSSAAVLIG